MAWPYKELPRTLLPPPISARAPVLFHMRALESTRASFRYRAHHPEVETHTTRTVIQLLSVKLIAEQVTRTNARRVTGGLIPAI